MRGFSHMVHHHSANNLYIVHMTIVKPRSPGHCFVLKDRNRASGVGRQGRIPWPNVGHAFAHVSCRLQATKPERNNDLNQDFTLDLCAIVTKSFVQQMQHYEVVVGGE